MNLLISTQAICKTYGLEPLFTDISLNVFANDRIGLIGPNGSGKSTLLKILSGLETPDNGKVIKSASTRLIYLSQEDSFDPTLTIQTILFNSDKLAPEEDLHRIWETCGEIVFTDLTQKVGELSGGWLKRLAIVRALLQKPDVLLLDEPTNHLDLEGILWLEALLKKTSFAFIMVSHDRYFLENTVNAVVELNKIYLDGYFKTTGNYSDFLQKREDFITSQINREKTLANKVRREEEWLRQGAKARTTKANYRILQAQQLQAELRKIHVSNVQTKTANIDFTATQRKTRILLETHELTMSRNNKLLFQNLNLKLSPGSCLGLLGKNGSGKSTLINLLQGNILPDSGYVERAEHLRIVSFDQKREQLAQNQTLKEALAPQGDSVHYKDSTIHVAAWAKRFLFPPDQLHQSVAKLSGGEQARVLIANLMLQPADILLLDEPTNDLDIPTLEVLEDSLQEFPGAIVLITHDRYLLERLSERLLYFDGNGNAQFFADYAQWHQVIGNKLTHNIDARTADSSQKSKVKKLSYDEQRELKRLPEKIHKAEIFLETLQAKLSQPEILNDQKKLTELCNQIQIEKEHIEQLFARWDELEQLKQ